MRVHELPRDGEPVLLHAGRIDEGLTSVDEALAIIARRARTFFWEAELHRLRGEMSLRRGERADARASYREALAVAGRQDARSLVLRAAMSLYRLESESGSDADRAEAHAALGDVHLRFTEGWETPDLREAAVLLAATTREGAQLPRDSSRRDWTLATPASPIATASTTKTAAAKWSQLRSG